METFKSTIVAIGRERMQPQDVSVESYNETAVSVRPKAALLAYRPFGAMRLFLALLVVLQHYLQWCYPGRLQRFLMPLAPGSTAVLVFFFLSGFVITEAANLIYRGRPGAFISNRLLRIVPLYILVIFVSFAGLYVLKHFAPLTDEAGRAASELFNVKNLCANLLAIIPLPGRVAVQPTFNVLRISWALRVEMAFYVGMALLLLVGMRWQRLSFQMLFYLSTVCCLCLAAWYIIARPAWNPLIAFAPYFCAGGSLFFVVQRAKFAFPLLATAIILSVVVTFYSQPEMNDPSRSNGGATALFVILLCVCVFLASCKATNRNLDRLMGDLSYPIYVGHWLPLLLYVSVLKAYPSIAGVSGQLAATSAAIGLPMLYFGLLEPATAKMRTFVRGVAIR